MSDIKPIVPLIGELAMPEKVWMQGPPGPQGQQGEPGAAATVTVGTVTTGEPGTDAIVTNSGTERAAVLNFTIPRGETGAVGPRGPKGDTGETGPAGAGVPDGGTVGQLLGKTETGTAWVDPPQSGGGVTTLHINVTAVNMETMEATFTADKTPDEMLHFADAGPIWCIVTFAAGIIDDQAVSMGVPPAWAKWEIAFGRTTLPVHDKNGNNAFIFAVRGLPPNKWVIDLRAFSG